MSKKFSDKVARSTVRDKINLERAMKPDLNSYFAKQARAVGRGDDNVINIQPVLEKHYKRVYKKLYSGKIKNTYLKGRVEEALHDRARLQSNYIDDTTRKNIKESYEEARQALVEEGNNNPSMMALNPVAKKYFKRKANGRKSGIALTETQQTYEGLRNKAITIGNEEMEKAIENEDKEYAEELALMMGSETGDQVVKEFDDEDSAALLLLLALPKKQWRTVGDNKVRADHVEANGQTRLITEPFEVGGEYLMFPGDVSMGASAGNVANCRCTAVYL